MTATITNAAIVRREQRRVSFKALMAMTDAELRTMNSNAYVRPCEMNSLFRALRKKGDVGSMARFFSRIMTEEEYVKLCNENRSAVSYEAGTLFGFKSPEKHAAAPAPTAGSAPVNAQLVGPKAEKEARALSRTFDQLARRGWTAQQITNANRVCTELRISVSKKLQALLREDVDPERAPAILVAHVEHQGVGFAAARSRMFLAIRVLALLDARLKDQERFEEFLAYCDERLAQLDNLRSEMHLDRRGKVADTMVAVKEMLRRFESAESGCSKDMRDLPFLSEEGAEWQHDGDSGRQLDSRTMAEVIDREIARQEIASHGIAVLEDEQPLAPDLGNFNPEKRRRRDGFFVETRGRTLDEEVKNDGRRQKRRKSFMKKNLMRTKKSPAAAPAFDNGNGVVSDSAPVLADLPGAQANNSGDETL